MSKEDRIKRGKVRYCKAHWDAQKLAGIKPSLRHAIDDWLWLTTGGGRATKLGEQVYEDMYGNLSQDYRPSWPKDIGYFWYKEKNER